MLPTLKNILLIFLIIIPIIIQGYFRFVFKGKIPTILVVIVSVVVFWLIVQFGVYLTNEILQAKVDAFDLNHNTFIDGDEVTEDALEALRQKTSDTGRALAPFTGAIFGVLYNGLLWFVLGLLENIWRVIQERKSKS